MQNKKVKSNDLGFIKLDQVLSLIPISKSKWYRGIKAGIYPRPKKLGRSALWPLEEINIFIEKIEDGSIESTFNKKH